MHILQLIMLIVMKRRNMIQLDYAGQRLEEKLKNNGMIEEIIGFANTVNIHPQLLLLLYQNKQ